MSHSRKARITAALIELLVLGFPCLPLMAREAKLTLHPQKTPAEVGKFSLLAPQGSLIEGDAVPLYEEAAKALPDKAGDDQILKWLEMPIDRLPLDQVEEALAKYMNSLKAAAKCRQCNWPEFAPGMEVKYLEEYRRLARVVQLWARLEIADEGYEGAILALQTELGISRHLGQAPTIIQVLVGTGIGALCCGQIEEFMQGKGAPNLYPAFASLPKPFVLMEKAIETERNVAGSQIALEGQSSPAQDRCRLIVKRFEANLAALQCVEAIRMYAASHGGQLPQTLADIREVSIPKDPVTDAPFRYTCTGSTAVLESSLPPGGNEEKDRIRYRMTIAH